MPRALSFLLLLPILAVIGPPGGPVPFAISGDSGPGTQDLLSGGALADLTPPASSGWQVIEKDGVQWLATPRGELFYSKGVNFLDAGKENAKSKAKQAFYWGNFFPTIEEWRRAAGTQLLEWGFNTRGGWSDPSP